MTASAKTLIAAQLLNLPSTVKEISNHTGYSESRVREVIKALENVQSDGGKPARFWLDSAAPVIEEAQVEETEAPVIDPDNTDTLPCPFCDSAANLQTAAGEPGTFMGDAVNRCSTCLKTYNIFSREAVYLTEPKAGKSGKGKRTILNPQNKINAKVKAVEAVGGSLVYEKALRLWLLEIPGFNQVRMNAEVFSTQTPETITVLG